MLCGEDLRRIEGDTVICVAAHRCHVLAHGAKALFDQRHSSVPLTRLT